MESKFGKLKSFVESLELGVVNSDEQAFLLVGGSGGSGGSSNDACVNPTDCRGSTNLNGCSNSIIC